MNTKAHIKGEIECHWLFSVHHAIPKIKYTHKGSRCGVPWWLAKLRIRCCFCSGLGCSWGVGLISDPRTSARHRHGQKSRKKKKESRYYWSRMTQKTRSFQACLLCAQHTIVYKALAHLPSPVSITPTQWGSLGWRVITFILLFSGSYHHDSNCWIHWAPAC